MSRILTHGIAVMTEEDAAGFVSEVGLVACSSSTFQRIPCAIAARYEANRLVIEAEICGQGIIPAAAVTVQAGIDGVMVPQGYERLLHEIVDLIFDLVLEEPSDLGEVAREQLFTWVAIARAPVTEQLEVLSKWAP